MEHLVPAGGHDRGGTAWSRVVPKWFGAWCAMRNEYRTTRSTSRGSRSASTTPGRRRRRWLAEVFGFEPSDALPDGPDPLPEGEYGHPWIEFRIGNAVLNVFKLEGERAGARTHVPWVYVDDLDAHYAHAKGSGADIVEEIHPYPGSSVYVADDLEGNRWTFSQARPTMR